MKVTLIAARTHDRAYAIAARRGWVGNWRMLTYEMHMAYPDADLYVDSTWAMHPNAATLEALIARRMARAAGRRLGPASRQAIAKTGA